MTTNYKPGHKEISITKETYNELMAIGQYKQTIDQIIQRLLTVFKDKKKGKRNDWCQL